MPSLPPSYAEVDYWDNRYEEDKEPFEWYQGYDGIRHFLAPQYLGDASADGPLHSIEDCRVLICGCGNSRLGEDMLGDGFRNITNIDFSSVVVSQMKDKYTDEWHEKLYGRLRRERRLEEVKPKNAVGKMVFECQDMTKKLTFADESFDLMIFKATFDAVLCSSKTVEKVKSMIGECYRVLAPKGVILIVSYGAPEHRLCCFDSNRWSVKTYTLPKPMVPGEKIGE